ncbi:MAG TPA: hypothetical protein PKA41_01360 [Verrucomicrobiota bacterium]|nr:hypothetical protein [Verrucomicrobiota bacterium]
MTNLLLGRNPVHVPAGSPAGRLVNEGGTEFYEIADYDQMRPFFMTIVSSGDLWMFLSSTGSLTAGRRNPDLALFPYYTDDKIHDAAETTGPKTIIIAKTGGKTFLWEPFSVRGQGLYRVRRNLLKSLHGNEIIFEEVNQDLGLKFRYGWIASEQFGWVRKSSLSHSGRGTVKVQLLDGVQNLLPTGISSQFQLEKSTLVDAYKKNELLRESGLGLFLLSSVPVDRPEPAESLRATTVWSAGIRPSNLLLSAVQLDDFRRGRTVRTETDVRAERGAYFIESSFDLKPGRTRDWMMVLDVDRSSAQVANLRRWLRNPARLQQRVVSDIARGAKELWSIVARADGLQKSARPIGDARHFNNVLFNVMRGGIFMDGYALDIADLRTFVGNANRTLAKRHSGFFRRLGKVAPRDQVLSLAAKSGDAGLERICQEYLPLSFSRRHGDPSRPWNRFSVAGRAEDGRRVLNYEGNWRDIFQNWEALAVSFPGFVSGMICKFVNASTADGYNPYRISRDGFDWEVHDPDDPWSHIGYWGDHQIIYLLKLLELLENREPVTLRNFLTREIFCFANVPYRIRPYSRLLANPRETVDFDAELDRQTRRLVNQVGADGRLIRDGQGRVRHVNLTEKLLIPVLAKFSNFIPGAGIWLNTQRPEWNDANNALVGNGASMVTLYQLRRHLLFCRQLFQSLQAREIRLSVEVAKWFSDTLKILRRQRVSNIGDSQRRTILDALGRAADKYRSRLYTHGFTGQKTCVERNDLLELFREALAWTDQTIHDNRSSEGLYHSYNLVEIAPRGPIPVRRLPVMLEGQAAILGSDCLSGKESIRLLAALKRSPLYREDQHSYLLYPDRRLPRFVEKNNIPRNAVNRSPLLKKLLADGNGQLVERDDAGTCHFHRSISNVRDLGIVLERLAGAGYGDRVNRESAALLALYEALFDHRTFTGRSGTFFGYEGLGCIYWHMVSKLLLSVQESFFRADRSSADRLKECYHDLRLGIGDFKMPESYGAFTMDPYSHTPAHAGARQPGLTGQVKEDILCRFGELGVKVHAGRIHFNPQLLRTGEFLTSPETFTYLAIGGSVRTIRLKAGSLAFTYCQVPVVYQMTNKPFLRLHLADGTRLRQESLTLDEPFSRSIFLRRDNIKSIVCGVRRVSDIQDGNRE